MLAPPVKDALTTVEEAESLVLDWSVRAAEHHCDVDLAVSQQL